MCWRNLLNKIRALFIGSKTKQQPQPRLPESRSEEAAASNPYSDRYETIIRQGHTRPTPEFAAPTLVCHVGIWSRRYIKNSKDLDP